MDGSFHNGERAMMSKASSRRKIARDLGEIFLLLPPPGPAGKGKGYDLYSGNCSDRIEGGLYGCAAASEAAANLRHYQIARAIT